MIVRYMNKDDRDEVFKMMRVFYDSPAVIQTSPDEVLLRDIDDCIGECPFIEGFVFDTDGKTAGYAMVARCYTTEYGGICVWVEDIYIKPEFRGMGIGTEFFRFLDEKYGNEAVRFRLDVEEENVGAISVYKKAGFSLLPYTQMSKVVE